MYRAICHEGEYRIIDSSQVGLRTSLDKQFLGNSVIYITMTITISPFHDHIEEVAEV